MIAKHKQYLYWLMAQELLQQQDIIMEEIATLRTCKHPIFVLMNFSYFPVEISVLDGRDVVKDSDKHDSFMSISDGMRKRIIGGHPGEIMIVGQFFDVAGCDRIGQCFVFLVEVSKAREFLKKVESGQLSPKDVEVLPPQFVSYRDP